MAYENKIRTSLFGRRFGLQPISTVESGGSRGRFDFLVGPEDMRRRVSTAPTTSANLHAFGVDILTSEVSSGVYSLDPPIPGVRKTLVPSTNGPSYIKVANQSAEFYRTSGGSSFTVAKLSSLGGCVELVGVTTAMWAVVNGSTVAGHTFSTST